MVNRLKIYYKTVSPIFSKIRFDGDQEILSDIRTIEKFIADRKNLLLEIGCGTGRYAEGLKKRGHDIIGIDISFDQLKCVDKSVRVYCASSSNLPFYEETFGGCLAIFMLQQLMEKEREKTLREVYRVLNNEGIFIIKTSSHDDIKKQPFLEFFPSILAIDIKRYPDIPLLTNQLKTNGFKILKIKSNIFVHTLKTADLLFSVKNKNISPLYLISKSEFEIGCMELEKSFIKKEHAKIALHYTLLICQKNVRDVIGYKKCPKV